MTRQYKQPIPKANPIPPHSFERIQREIKLTTEVIRGQHPCKMSNNEWLEYMKQKRNVSWA